MISAKTDKVPQSAAISGPGRPVLMLVGGGLEEGGGIGRMVGYVLDAWNRQAGPRMTVIDTRGPKYRRILWPFYLLGSIARIIAAAPSRPIVHIHIAANTSTLRKLIMAAASRFCRLPYIIQLHDPKYAEYYARQPGWLKARIRAAFAGAAKVIALGRPAAAMMATVLAVPPDRIDIIANAVPGPAEIADEPDRRDGLAPHILFLGHLIRRKGVHDLIAALSRPELQRLSWHMTLAGGGPEQAGFAAQAADGGIGDRVAFPGWVPGDTVRDLLRSADILVLPSYAEEMAMSVLEGMAYGLCLVCTPVGAQAEVIEDDVSALVIEPGDVDGLAAALARAIADPGLRRRVGQGARAAYLQRYNIDDYPGRLAAIYRQI